MKNFKNKIYFNYAGFGPIPRELYGYLIKIIKEYYEIGPPEIIKKYRNYIDKFKGECSKLLNCEKNEITYIKNTTDGIILASESLPLHKKDEVLIMDKEYSANYIPWLKKKRDGLKLNIIYGQNNEECFNKLLNSINNATKIISISWIQYYDGYMANLMHLSNICKKKKIFLIVDAIQGVGIREIDLKKIKIDMMICGGHKHIMSLPGCGFLYVNKNIISKLNHYKIGIRSVKMFNCFEYKLKNNAERFEDGTPNLIGILALYYSVKRINKIGIKNIESKSTLLLKKYKELLRQSKIPFIDYKNQGNIISIKVRNPKKTCEVIERKNIYIKVIRNVLRISFNFKNNINEFKYLIKIIKDNKLL